MNFQEIVNICVENGYTVRIGHEYHPETIHGYQVPTGKRTIAMVPISNSITHGTFRQTLVFLSLEDLITYVKENFNETAQISAQPIAPRPSKMQGQEPDAGSDEQPAEGGMEGRDRLPQSAALGRLSVDTANGVLLHFTRGV